MHTSARHITRHHIQPSRRRCAESGAPLALAALTLLVAALFSASGCGNERPHGADEAIEHVHAAVFTNGDFESSAIGATPGSWTLATNTNPAITDTRPSAQTLASLNLAAGGYAATFVVGGAAESQADPDLGASATLKYPRYGVRAARVNYISAGSNSTTGANSNSNTIKQTMTITNADVDTADNKAHVRFAVAPVLQNPSHPYNQQPYYFVRLQNITQGTTLYSDFNASAQDGVPWKIVGSGTDSIYYTDWQMVDIAPGNNRLAVGDQVELTVIASGCSPGGHWGRVYVDGVGASVPGIYTYATGPTSANANTNITYTVYYKNGGTASTTTTKLDTVLPTNTTFQSVSIPGACTTPAVNAAGTVSCTLGTLAPGAAGSFTITVKIASGASGTTITHGNYYIYASGVSALLGPKVLTSVTSGATYADVGITKSNGVAGVAWSGAVTYTIVASNPSGPSNAPSVTVADTLPAQLTGATWTCAAAGGATCPAASGSGSINASGVSLPIGGSVTYTVSATVIAGSGSGTVTNTATATIGGTVTDSDTSNNTAVDTDAIGPLRTLTLTKTGAAGGTVASVPSAINCGTACSSATGSFADGTSVVLSASTVAGGSFTGWGGACASAGSSPTCTLTLSADQSITATFVPPPSISTNSGSGQSAAVSTAFAAPIVAKVVDSSGNPLSGQTVVFSVPASGASATLSAASATTNAQGLASVTVTANATAGAYTVTAGISGQAASTTFSLSNYGAPASIAVISGTPQSAVVATAFAAPLLVEVRDAVNQVVPGATVTFAAPGSGARATLSAATATTGSTGRASVNATAHQIAGTYSVTATVTGVASGVTFALTNTFGAAAAIAATSGGGQSAVVNTVFTSALVATVTDTYGNPVSGATVTFAAPASGARAALSAATATTNAAGQASVTPTAGTVAGGYNVTASVSGAATSATFALTNTFGAATTITATSGGGQSATVGAAFAAALVATVTDTYGNPVSGALVTFAAPGSGARATLSAATVTTGATGQASVTATAGATAGGYNVTASVSGVATSASFALTNTAGTAASVTATSGGGQSAQVNTAFAAALLVTVRDASSNPVSGVTVTFTPPGSGATAALSGGTATTNAAGQASVTATAGATAGSYTVTASVTGVATTAGFALTNTAGAPGSITATSGGGQSAQVSTAFGAALLVTVRDGSSNPVPGATVTFTAPGSGASAALSSATATTNASGQASVTVTANATAGSYVVSASASGVATSATFALTNYAALSLSPSSATLPPRGSRTFAAAGGPGTSYTYSLPTNASGGSVNPSTGLYTAGPTPNVTDVVRVVDGAGTAVTATVTVGPGVTIGPSAASVAPRASQSFTASGGSGTGYSYAVTTNASGGAVNASSGTYVAGATPSVTDVVTVTDSLGNSATATITVGAGVNLSPATASTPPRGSVTLTASGGSATGFAYAVTSNASGGAVDATGKYTAGDTGSVTDVVTVTDSVGNTATTTITVGPAVTLAGSATSAPPRGALTFSASGGSGTGFVFTLSANGSGGSINPSTGAYTAGSNASVTDVVLVTDSLGNTATANVAVGPGITLTPASPVVPPMGVVHVVASGGSGTGFVFVLSTNASGGSVGAASGSYVAGGAGNKVDVVTVTDSVGNTANLQISVGGGLTLSPSGPSLAPRERQTFAAAGGSGAGFTYAFVTNASGGTIDAASGAYVAGPTGSTTDVVKVTDSLGNSATATVTVGPGLQITPSPVTLAPRGQRTFGVSGGSGTGFAFSLATNASGGSVNAATGDYAAGDVGGVTDQVTVVDSLGNSASASITVTAALAPVASTLTLPPRGAATLAVTGGAGGNTFTLTVNGSGGSVDPVTGAYVAGPTGGTSDIVTVTDANGATTVVTISVTPGLSLSPASPATTPRGSLTITASGGSGTGYQYELTASPSGGSIVAGTGAYTAGAIAEVVDVVRVTDSLGNTATANIAVGNGLAVNLSAATVAPRGSLTVSAVGGSGTGYHYELATNQSGGTIDATTGAYVAGATPSVTDVVRVTDSVGNTVTVNVVVGPGLLITPAAATTPPQGSVALAASGGSGTGYVFALTANGSGASIDATTGRYTAGTTAVVADTVTVTDSLGNTATATITVGAGVTVTAPSSASPPRGTLAVTASGGSGSYTFALRSNGSGGSIVSSTGLYTAGAAANTVDVVEVTDALGNTGTFQITVGAGVTLAPAVSAVTPNGVVSFAATGGSGSGYTYALTTNGSGGTVDPATGAYAAGTTPSSTDVVTVTDSLGNTATATVAIGDGLGIGPQTSTVPPRGTVQFMAAGGSGSGYIYAITTNASGGTIDPATGRYRAGTVSGAVDEITVSDASGKIAVATVTVGPGLTLTPATSAVGPAGAVAFAVSGGSGSGYTYAITTNRSGGTIDAATGRYRAGATGATTDTVTVTDSLGNTATATVTVSGVLTITPPTGGATVIPRGSTQIVVTGGAAPYKYTLTTNGSGGTINPMTGVYTAGSKGNATDVITVTDANGNTTTITVTTGPGVTLDAGGTTTVRPGSSTTLVATGGSGTGYTFTVIDGPTGGSIDPATGVYTAPTNAPKGATVTVEVTDSLGNTSRITLPVTASAVYSLNGGGGCSVSGGGGGEGGGPAGWAGGGLMALLGIAFARRRRARK